MIDDLRDQIQGSSPSEDDQVSFEYEDAVPPIAERRILGMTAAQRLVIAVMLFMMICILGALILLVTGTVVPPFI